MNSVIVEEGWRNAPIDTPTMQNLESVPILEKQPKKHLHVGVRTNSVVLMCR